MYLTEALYLHDKFTLKSSQELYFLYLELKIVFTSCFFYMIFITFIYVL